MLRLGAIFTVCGAIMACSPPVLCPGSTEYPVRVELLKDGELFTSGADVTYALNDGNELDCQRSVDEGHVYGCGTDRVGDYQISVSINGRQDVQKSTKVEMDGCRLSGQTLEVEIGKPCEDNDVVSVHVLVEDAADSSPIEDAVVKYQPIDQGGGMRSCEAASEPNGWNCGENEAGDMRIAVLKSGYTDREQRVYVEQGSCDIVTEELVVQLEAE